MNCNTKYNTNVAIQKSKVDNTLTNNSGSRYNYIISKSEVITIIIICYLYSVMILD